MSQQSEPTLASQSPPPSHPPLSRPNPSSSSKFGPLFSTPHRPRPHSRRPRRRSVDSARHRNINNPSFEHESTVFVELDDDDHNVPSTATITAANTMIKPADNDHRNSRRQVLRIDAQDGPWTISVAENPHDSIPSYSLYVKTPTHNLTLTRTAREIADLHAKLHETFPHVALPALPFNPAALPPPKRKSAFLNTLSRLASPSRASKSGLQHGITHATNPPSSFTTPRTEQDDPFAMESQQQQTEQQLGSAVADDTATSAVQGNGTPQSPQLSAYLSALANDQLLRTARAWKRFVRVRTDDLESVRVERAIKRVRSDLAAHVAGGNTVSVHVLTEDNVNGEKDRKRLSRFREEIIDDGELGADGKEEGAAEQLNGHVQEETATTAVPDTPVGEIAPATVPENEAEPGPESESQAQEEDTAPATPVQSDVPPRIPRSQSADPDKAVRMTLARAFAPSSASESSRADTTGDDSTTGDNSPARRGKSKSRRAALSKRKVSVADFEMLRVLGKGCAGKVLLVRYRKEGDLYALKAITKRHVLAHQELQHTLTEQAVLKRMAAEARDPFVVRLHWSFHDKENLFLVMDFHPGGDLATQLARWGRLGRDRARFYAAEIVEGVEGLHAAGVIYRDLKPENILIASDGHIVLTDFGLSKEFARKSSAITAPSTPNGRHTSFGSQQQAQPYWMADGADGQEWPARGVGSQMDTTSTFCGTAEYLAPEVIQGLPYSYEVDWWSFGTMLYEMLTGITPFWADNHSDMYVRVLQDELQFPDDRAMDQDTKSLIRGLLQRNPALRIREPRIKRHPYFSMIDWSHVYYKRYIPPYIPPIDPSNASDTQNFDDTFLDMEPVINDVADEDETDQEMSAATDTDRESAATPSGSRSPSVHPVDDDVDVFDGYSYKGRHSVIMDDGVDEEEEEEEEDSEARSILAELNGSTVAAKTETELEEGTPEPKTPEARKPALPEEQPRTPVVDTAVAVQAAARASTERPPLSPTKETLAAAQAAAAASNGPDIHRKEVKAVLPPKTKPKKRAPRREKSGVPYLDQDFSGDDEAEDEDEAPTERDEEDDDWDIVEANGEGGEDRNGARGTSLFARGVVDRYKLAVFRKGMGSTPSRSVSGVSSTLSGVTASPTDASPKDRRGRAGLPFRRAPKPFLRPKSPPSSRTSRSTPGTLSSQRSLGVAGSPSLKSRPSETSFGSPPSSSDASITEETAHGGMTTHDEADETRAQLDGDAEKDKPQKNRKLKKYKEGAEKVLSLFASPR